MEILFHPDGKYTSVRIEDKDAKLREAATALSEKDEEIARLKAELAKAKEAKPAEQAKPAEPEKPAKAKKETKKEEK